MAKKGQKFDKHSKEFKEQILQEYFDGKGGSRCLGKKYDISSYTIDTWIRKRKKPELYNEGQKKGRKKEAEINYKEKYETLKKYQTFLKAQREKK